MTPRPPLSARTTALTLLLVAALTTSIQTLVRNLSALIAAKRIQARAEPDAGYLIETVLVIGASMG